MRTRTLGLLLAPLLALPALAGCFSDPGVGGEAPFPVPGSATPVSGSGATFPKPLLEVWALEYQRSFRTIQVSYAGGGSGKGIGDITARNVVFAGSDAPMKASERAAAPGILHIPETLGLVAVVYNVAGIPDGLKLDGETVGKIYSGAITRWNDPAMAALNPGLPLPDRAIAVVYRSDSSGTTFVYTDWLSRTSPAWVAAMGAGASKKPDWTRSTATQLSGNGNDGVSTTVKTTPDSIGYVEYAYVKVLGLHAAHLKNKAGEFLPPSTSGAGKAAEGAAAALPAPSGDWSAVSIVDTPGAGAYPISSFSYILVFDRLSAYGGAVTADQLNAFRNWLWYGLHQGQVFAEELGYAPLPAAVVTLGEGALNGMQVAP